MLRAAREKLADVLLDRGAAIDQLDGQGYSALLLAVAKGKADTVEMLLSRGANHGLRINSGFTALHLAAYEGHEPVLRLLLRYGADPAATNNFGKTPLDVARNCNRTGLIPVLEQAEENARQADSALLP